MSSPRPTTPPLPSLITNLTSLLALHAAAETLAWDCLHHHRSLPHPSQSPDSYRPLRTSLLNLHARLSTPNIPGAVQARIADMVLGITAELEFFSEDMERSVDNVFEFRFERSGEGEGNWGGGEGMGEEMGEEDMGGEDMEGEEMKGEDMGGKKMGEEDRGKKKIEGEWRKPLSGAVLREVMRGLIQKWEEMVSGVEGLV